MKKVTSVLLPSLFKGLLAGVLGVVAVLFFIWLTPKVFMPGKLFLYWGIKDFLFYILIAGIFLYIFQKTGESNVDRFHGQISFITGVFFMANILDWIWYMGMEYSYTLFLLPVLRIALMIDMVLLIQTGWEHKGIVRVLYICLILPVSAAAAIVPMFYFSFSILWAVLTTLLFGTLSFGGFMLFKRNYSYTI